MKKDSITVGEAVRKTYEYLDPIAQQRSVELGATCTKGCNHCCYLFATITLAEGMYIAEELLKKPDWKALIPELVEAAKKTCYDGVNKANYLAKVIPCVFLKNGLCSIYETRPAACRYHFVKSNPDRCKHDHPDGKTLIINMIPLEEKVWDVSKMVVAQHKEMAAEFAAPIPLMVLFALVTTLAGRDVELTKAVEGLPTPSQYAERYISSIMEGTALDPNRMPTEEDHEKLGKA